MYQPQRILIKDVNEYLTCKLCSGYFIDATTIIECLHSFCRSCIVKYLQSNKYCPVCDVLVHKSKPFLNIKQDKALQNVVYKLVPKLLHNEKERRRKFYVEHPKAKPTGFEKRGETAYEHILSVDDTICISLIYKGRTGSPRYLRCPAGVSMLHLKKLIGAKYDLNDGHKVDIFYNQDCLNSYLTLMDVAYIYSWIRKDPLEFTYCIYEKIVDNKTKGSDVEQESLTNKNNDWKEVQLRISESGEMSITGIEDCLNLIEKDFIKVETTPVVNTEAETKPIIIEPPIVKKSELVFDAVLKEEKVSTSENATNEIKDEKKKIITDKIEDKKVDPIQKEVEFKISEEKTSVNEIVAVDLKDSNENITSTVNNGKRKFEEDIKLLDIEPSSKVLKPVDIPITRSSKMPITIISNCKIPSSVNCIKKQADIIYKRPIEKFNSTEISSNLNTKKNVTTTSTVSSCKTSLPSITTGVNSFDIKLKPQLDVISNPDKAPPPIYTPPKSNTKVKSAFSSMCYKTLRNPPKSWNPQISRSAMLKSDGKEENKNLKPAKFFKMRNNMPRYLGNPASGVKPMYQLHPGSEKEKKSESSEIRKHSIVKIDPKTLKPISERAPATEALCNQSDLKINTSSVSIFSPLKLHSGKSELKAPKSPVSKKTTSTPAKREKLNVTCTPSNPFIPNLSSPTVNPNQFLYPSGPSGFPSYDPRIMVAYHSLLYGPQVPFHSSLIPNINPDSASKKYDIPQASNSKNSYRALPSTNDVHKNVADTKQKPTKKESSKNDKTLQSALEKIVQNKKKECLKQDESFKINNLVRESKPDVCKENVTSDINQQTKSGVVPPEGEDNKVLIKSEGGGEVVQKPNTAKDDLNIATSNKTCDNKGSAETSCKTEKNSILENCTMDNVKNVLSGSDTKKF